MPFPSTGFTSGVFSTLVSYRHAAGRLRFLAVSADRGRAVSPTPAGSSRPSRPRRSGTPWASKGSTTGPWRS
nr:hypothetical protein GCM10020093_013240 [Planobispora longispora]